MTAPVIPVSFEDVSDHYSGDTVVNRLKFVLPSFGAECWADYVSSRTGAAIKRVTKIIDMERAGATKPEIVDAVDALYRTAKHHSGRDLSTKELDKFRRENGWNEPVEPAQVEEVPQITVHHVSPAGVNDRDPLEGIQSDPLIADYVESLQEITPAPGELEGTSELPHELFERVGPAPSFDDAPVVTSDGRYIVDPVAGTIEPVEDIPADIVAVMPVWGVIEATPENCAAVEFWPRSFDIPAEQERAFEIEMHAASALLTEIGEILWGAVPRDLRLSDHGAQLIDF